MVKKIFLFLFYTIHTYSHGIQIEIKGNSLLVQDQKVLDILTPKDGIPPLKRLENIKKNFKTAYLNPKCSIKAIPKSLCTYFSINDHLIAIITAREAKKQGTTQKKLSEKWKNNLLKALNQPPFLFDKETFFLGERTSLGIKPKGKNIQNIQIINETPDVIDAHYQHNILNIFSKKIGKGSITVALDSYKKILSFEILPLSASIPNEIYTYIVGQNHSIETLKKNINRNIFRACKTVPFAKIKSSFENISLRNSEKSYSTKVLVEVEAPNSAPVSKYVNVSIENLGMPHKVDHTLWYCNHPENIKRFGDIGAIQLNSGFPMRILFHHMNRMPHKIGIQFLIKNYSDQPAKLVLVHGEGDPHLDPVKVGLEAAKRFMRTHHNNLGDVLEIPPKHEIPLAIQKLNPKETMSGLHSICLLPSGPQDLYITAQVLPIYQLEHSWKSCVGKPFPWHTAEPILINRTKDSWSLSPHLFPTPQKKIEVDYRTNGPFCFIRLGEVPITRGIEKEILEGNFGVTYQIKTLVTNPTPKPVTIEAVFEASAGYSSGVFIVNHQLKTAPLLPSKKEFILKTMTLQPFQKKVINITTLPISGSSYPATITIRPVHK